MHSMQERLTTSMKNEYLRGMWMQLEDRLREARVIVNDLEGHQFLSTSV